MGHLEAFREIEKRFRLEVVGQSQDDALGLNLQLAAHARLQAFTERAAITELPRRRLKSTDPRPCECNAPVIRLIGTGGGIIFKGSGFYQTDYRSESYKKAAKAEKEAGSNGKAKKDGTAKKETTPAKQEAKTGT